MSTRTFTIAELDELGLPDSEEVVHIERNVEEKRWANVHHVVFRCYGTLWRVEYFEGATENQESGWGYGTYPTEVTAHEVRPVQVTTVKYQLVKEASR